MVIIDKLAPALITVALAVGLAPHAVQMTSVETHNTVFEPTVQVASGNETGNVSVGVSPGDGDLEFGTYPVGATDSVSRDISLGTSTRSLAMVSTSGNISEKISVPERAYFEGDRSFTVEVTTDEPGYYTGELVLKTYTPKNQLGKAWVDARSQLPF